MGWEMGWDGMNWVGKWVGLGCDELSWDGMGWVGMNWVGKWVGQWFFWIGVGWVGLGHFPKINGEKRQLRKKSPNSAHILHQKRIFIAFIHPKEQCWNQRTSDPN